MGAVNASVVGRRKTFTLTTLSQPHGPDRQLSAFGWASLKETRKGHSLVPLVSPVVAAACGIG